MNRCRFRYRIILFVAQSNRNLIEQNSMLKNYLCSRYVMCHCRNQSHVINIFHMKSTKQLKVFIKRYTIFCDLKVNLWVFTQQTPGRMVICVVVVFQFLLRIKRLYPIITKIDDPLRVDSIIYNSSLSPMQMQHFQTNIDRIWSWFSTRTC